MAIIDDVGGSRFISKDVYELVQSAFYDGYYEGAGKECWYQDHQEENNNGDLPDKASFSTKKFEEFVKDAHLKIEVIE